MNKVKDCIKLSCLFLGLDDALNNIDDPTNQDICQLLSCFNLIVNEIACDYYPLVKKQNITIVEDRFMFKDLPVQLVDVIGLEKNGAKVPYKVFYDCIIAPKGEYCLEYSFCPSNLTINDDIPFFSQHISPRVIAYGVACEYCIIHASNGEALMWDKRFREKLFTTTSKRKVVEIKPRVWR